MQLAPNFFSLPRWLATGRKSNGLVSRPARLHPRRPHHQPSSMPLLTTPPLRAPTALQSSVPLQPLSSSVALSCLPRHTSVRIFSASFFCYAWVRKRMFMRSALVTLFHSPKRSMEGRRGAFGASFERVSYPAFVRSAGFSFPNHARDDGIWFLGQRFVLQTLYCVRRFARRCR